LNKRSSSHIKNGKRLGDIKAKSKLMLIIGSGIYICFLIMSVIINSIYSGNVISESRNSVIQQTKVAIQNIRADLNIYAQALYAMRLDKTLHKMISNNEFLNFYEFSENINEIDIRIQSLISICISKPKLALYLNNRSQYSLPINSFSYVNNKEPVQNEPWFINLSTSNRAQIVWEIQHQSDAPASFYPILNVSIALRNLNRPSTDFIGFVRISQSTEIFAKMVESSLDLVNGILFILDSENQTVFFSDKNSRTIPAELTRLNLIKGSSLFDSYLDIDMDGGKKTVFFVYDSEMDWKYIYITNSHVNVENVLLTGRTFLLLLIPFIAFSLLLILVFFTKIIRRLSQLTQLVEKVNSNQLFLNTDISGDDEVGILADKFKKVLDITRSLIEQNRKSERERFTIELEALQLQINPHFLFNSLSAINSMATEIEANDISRALIALAKFYRLCLSYGADIITIDDEIKLLQTYIEICQIRFGNRLTISIDVNPVLLTCYTPKLIVQPIVENAIMHGLKSGNHDYGNVSITVRQKSDHAVMFQISDNGVGMDADTIDHIIKSKYDSKNHHAIKSIDYRLKFRYGAMYGIDIQSQVNTGTTVTILIPKLCRPDQES
jgi:two-component system, sensor histidine kinase YesM